MVDLQFFIGRVALPAGEVVAAQYLEALPLPPGILQFLPVGCAHCGEIETARPRKVKKGYCRTPNAQPGG